MKKENLEYLRKEMKRYEIFSEEEIDNFLKEMEHFNEEERPYIIEEIEVAIDCYSDEKRKGLSN